MTFYYKTGKEKAVKVTELQKTEDVFMILPYDRELYLKFYKEGVVEKMTIHATESDVDITYAITGQKTLFVYPCVSNIIEIQKLIESRRKIF